MSEIRKELEKATKAKQGKKESDEEFLIMLAEKCEDISDKKWDKLSEPAQEWINDALTALEDSKPVANFPDVVEEEEAEEEEEQEEEPAKKDKKAKKGKKAKKEEAEEEEEVEEEEEEKPAKKDKKAAKKDKKAAKKEPKKKRVSAISRVQYFSCKHPKLPVEKIAEKVRKEFPDVAEATIRIQYSIAHNIMKTLTELGWSI